MTGKMKGMREESDVYEGEKEKRQPAEFDPNMETVESS